MLTMKSISLSMLRTPELIITSSRTGKTTGPRLPMGPPVLIHQTSLKIKSRNSRESTSIISILRTKRRVARRGHSLEALTIKRWRPRIRSLVWARITFTTWVCMRNSVISAAWASPPTEGSSNNSTSINHNKNRATQIALNLSSPRQVTHLQTSLRPPLFSKSSPICPTNSPKPTRSTLRNLSVQAFCLPLSTSLRSLKQPPPSRATFKLMMSWKSGFWVNIRSWLQERSLSMSRWERSTRT